MNQPMNNEERLAQYVQDCLRTEPPVSIYATQIFCGDSMYDPPGAGHGIDTFSLNKQLFRAQHCVEGICTEVGELWEATLNLGSFAGLQNYIEELGDAFWYVGVLSDVIGLRLDEYPFMEPKFYPDVDSTRATLVRLTIESAKLLEALKKRKFYPKKIVEKDFEIGVYKIFTMLCRLTDYGATSHNLTPLDVMEANIRKLKARYPDKFTTEAAVNRNTANEMEALNAVQPERIHHMKNGHAVRLTEAWVSPTTGQIEADITSEAVLATRYAVTHPEAVWTDGYGFEPGIQPIERKNRE